MKRFYDSHEPPYVLTVFSHVSMSSRPYEDDIHDIPPPGLLRLLGGHAVSAAAEAEAKEATTATTQSQLLQAP
jgi:hypothetical protein